MRERRDRQRKHPLLSRGGLPMLEEEARERERERKRQQNERTVAKMPQSAGKSREQAAAAACLLAG